MPTEPRMTLGADSGEARVACVCVVGGWAKEPTPVTDREVGGVPTEPRLIA